MWAGNEPSLRGRYASTDAVGTLEDGEQHSKLWEDWSVMFRSQQGSPLVRSHVSRQLLACCPSWERSGLPHLGSLSLPVPLLSFLRDPQNTGATWAWSHSLSKRLLSHPKTLQVPQPTYQKAVPSAPHPDHIHKAPTSSMPTILLLFKISPMYTCAVTHRWSSSLGRAF
jgi:hypothetical protein